MIVSETLSSFIDPLSRHLAKKQSVGTTAFLQKNERPYPDLFED
ncbi:hypothetical protein LEP1GSC021_3464 [Leptospira noguchii str. 1993005606]|nr:hypothetical protein LEP1GSC021_3464 [Leptospira noguchii str. 1993005606]